MCLCGTGVTSPSVPVSQSLLETHDSVAAKSYEAPPGSPGPGAALGPQPVPPPDAVRMVGIRKAAGENLVSPTGGLGGCGGGQGVMGGGFGVMGGFWGVGECWGVAALWGIVG